MTIWRRTLWRYRVTTAGAALTAFGAATAVNNPPRLVSVVAAVAGCLVSATEIAANRRRARMIRFQPRDGDTYRDVADQAASLGPVVVSAHDVGVLLSRESRRLRHRPVRATADRTPYRLPRDLRTWSFDFVARRARNAAMFNGAVLGLATDLPGDDEDATVTMRPARYFDFLCSNLLAPFDVWEVGRKLPTLRGRDLILDRHGRLRTLRRSRLANVVGISTLAFTTDGLLLLVAQTRDNVGSPGLIAPSGSGALEPADLPSGGTVQDSIRAGAERELREECNLRPQEIVASDILGHGRWISRGAMPEFCAVTLLDLTCDQALDRRVRRTERPYVAEVRGVTLAPWPTWDPTRPLDMLPEEDRHSASWPLRAELASRLDNETAPTPIGDGHPASAG
ncbi:hypothetical protein ACTMS0_01360 [Micromonospora sp. H33]|uniref:hypothetical protein n=1 Tax=Micromonospora sp. H33 TaxID=3452215 RepID=UPI003F89C45D